MSDWEDGLTASERQQWQDFVLHTRNHTVAAMAHSACYCREE